VIVQQRRGCSGWTVLLLILVIALTFALLMALGALGIVTSMKGGLSTPGTQKVAVIDIRGLITSSAAGGLTGAADGILPVVEHLRDAAKDESVKAIVLWVDSPGGSPAASQAVYSKVMEIRAKKPIVAAMGDVAASGAYYISAAATKIVAGASTETGSIGVIFTSMNVAGLLGKYGVSDNVIKSGAFKDMGSPFRPMRPDEQALIKALIMDIYDQFVTDVATARNMPRASVLALADGRVWTGRQALKLGLVDQLGSRDDAIKLAAQLGGIKGWPTLKEYQQLPDWLKALAMSSSARWPWYSVLLDNPGPWLTLPMPGSGFMTFPAARP
jgi:protease-4